MIRNVLYTLVFAVALGACGPGDAGDASPDATPEAASTPDARPIRGMRAIDRARETSDLASQRALRHDTIR